MQTEYLVYPWNEPRKLYFETISGKIFKKPVERSPPKAQKHTHTNISFHCDAQEKNIKTDIVKNNIYAFKAIFTKARCLSVFLKENDGKFLADNRDWDSSLTSRKEKFLCNYLFFSLNRSRHGGKMNSHIVLVRIIWK